MSSETKERSLRYAHYSTPDPDFDKYKDMPSPFAEMKTLSAVDMRAIMAQVPVMFPYDEAITESVEISHRTMTARDGAELELRIYKNRDVGQKSTLFFVAHGGGWVLGDHQAEEPMNRLVAKKTNSVVVSVNYRLAPEYQFPYAVNDCFDAMQWCRQNADTLGINPMKIIVGGSSSGGNIAAVLALKDRDEGIGAVIGQVLNIPDICHPAHFPKDKYEYNSPEQNRNAPVMPTHAAHWFWEQYCPTAGANPYASPLLSHSLEGLPPALIQVAGQDPIRDEGLAYCEALEEAGVPVQRKIYAGLPHAFHLFPDLKATTEFYDTIIEWIRTLQDGK
ncbi:alpha/beta hydrolase fold-domain-containing protein [Aspergillus caelatus]|uniref:Alpha/beta hydrolase fold-domain-containing protein n=1 Tax=Aspergillus caelatus TaxID=61420 RepID=A0A5N6ZVZ2_9EURO|nr:alpha/beta hydrolase fold-domain-containing protein [Aspergillus caelatus]KAE8361109.1 alpha/beta hydrolase fold-domain-containing protein [Aspergillus caelatus]